MLVHLTWSNIEKFNFGQTKNTLPFGIKGVSFSFHTFNVHFCMMYGSTEPFNAFMSSIQNELLKHCGVPNPSLYGTKQVIHVCLLVRNYLHTTAECMEFMFDMPGILCMDHLFLYFNLKQYNVSDDIRCQ